MKKTRAFGSRFLRVLFLLPLLAAALGVMPVRAAGVLYAKPSPSGSGDCLTWDNACDLQTTLATALSGDEIWVAGGIYKPTATGDRLATFQLKDGVALYGGFATTETERSQRTPALNVSNLNGDLNGDDNGNIQYNEPTRAENSFHVVTGATGATLDGFSITGGNAYNSNGFCPGLDCGGGMYNDASSPTLVDVSFSANTAGFGGGMYNLNSSPALTDVRFDVNTCLHSGGGMYNSASSPVLSHVAIRDNAAYNYGGGMYNTSGSNPALTDVTFSGNITAYAGGGMWNDYSSPTLTNVTFSANTANDGGGMSNSFSTASLTDVTFSANTAARHGGGMINASANPTLTNVTFSGNAADSDGGGIYNYNSSPTLTNITLVGNTATPTGGGTHNGGGIYNDKSSPTLTNMTFSGNAADTYGGGIYNAFGSSPKVRNTILWGNTAGVAGAQVYAADLSDVPEVSDSVVQDGCPTGSTCGVIISTDPNLGSPGDYGGLTQTIPLMAGSSAVDMGNDLLCPATDQRGVSRPQGPHCDIGAYEGSLYLIYLPLVIY